jgi:hypothetical protein
VIGIKKDTIMNIITNIKTKFSRDETLQNDAIRAWDKMLSTHNKIDYANIPGVYKDIDNESRTKINGIFEQCEKLVGDAKHAHD